jgi:hypothetical protein
MITWNQYVKENRTKINKKRKRSKLDPLSYKEVLKVCSESWAEDKQKLLKKQKRADKKKVKEGEH